MRVLLLGTSGQLSTELQRQAASRGVELAPVSKLDLTDHDATLDRLERTRPELILNASAYTAVDRAESEPERAHALNAEGPALLARWSREHGCALFHVSTDYVFDGGKAVPYTEADPTAPLGVYGRSKLAGETQVQKLERHVILRTSWVFSAHGQNFVKTMLRLAEERDELRVVSDQIGRPTSAADLARVMLELAARVARGAELRWGTYHFAGRGDASWHDLAVAVVEERGNANGRRPRVMPITTAEYPTPAKRPANSRLDTQLFEQTFGIAPRAWRDELRGVVRELVAHSKP